MAPLLLVIYFGGVWLFLLALLISIIGLDEFYKGFENLGYKPAKLLGELLTIILFISIRPYLFTQPEEYSRLSTIFFVFIWFFIAVAASCIYGFRVSKVKLNDVLSTIVGLVYIPFFACHMVILGESDYSKLLWIIVIAAFGQDICAYFIGYFLGKHKMAPILSPKKTIEGAIGGLLGSTLLSGLFGYFFYKEQLLLCFILGLLGGAAGMAGDLTASMFKRHMGIKDYGNLIPGHGGIMDRFDSILFTAPVVFYLAMILNGVF